MSTTHAILEFAVNNYQANGNQTGQKIADGLKGFVAPLAAILVGVMGLKFLFGENKSLAGFIGFLILGICVYALIQWGDRILSVLGNTVQGWI